MRNDPAWNIQLVKAVEKYPIIWNTKLQRYGNRPETEKAWNAIAKQLNESPSSCNEKWKVLRNSFSRAIRKNPQYYLAKYMAFVKPFMHSKVETAPNINTSDEEFGDIADESLEQSNYVDIVEDEYKDIELLPEDNIEDVGTSENINEIETIEHTSKKRKTDFEESFVEYVTLLKQTKLDPDSENPDFVFFKSLLPDIEKLDHSDKMKFKMSVLDTLNELLYNKDHMSD